MNRVGNIADFGHKWGKGFGKRAAHSHPIFQGVPPPPGVCCRRLGQDVTSDDTSPILASKKCISHKLG